MFDWFPWWFWLICAGILALAGLTSWAEHRRWTDCERRGGTMVKVGSHTQWIPISNGNGGIIMIPQQVDDYECHQAKEKA